MEEPCQQVLNHLFRHYPPLLAHTEPPELEAPAVFPAAEVVAEVVAAEGQVEK